MTEPVTSCAHPPDEQDAGEVFLYCRGCGATKKRFGVDAWHVCKGCVLATAPKENS